MEKNKLKDDLNEIPTLGWVIMVLVFFAAVNSIITCSVSSKRDYEHNQRIEALENKEESKDE